MRWMPALVLAFAAVLALPASPGGRAPATLAALEAHSGGRLGVAALDTGTGRRLEHRANERFAMCSTFKVLLAAAVLSRADRGGGSLEKRLPYSPADLLQWAPVTREHVEEGGMRVGDLCAAAIELSDNTAANLLLRDVGGPASVTRYARSLGDGATRLDRTEPDLNSNLPGDLRDTTTPAAMVETLRKVLLGDALSPESRRRLTEWMVGCRTGGARLRAGLPASWKAGDKTGSGDHGAANDVAVLWPPGRPPVLAVAYFSGPETSTGKDRDAVLAQVGRIVAEAFGRGPEGPSAPASGG